MGREKIVAVDSRAADGLTAVKTANKRAEMWQRMKEWLAQGSVAIPDDTKLETQLTNVEYAATKRNNAILQNARTRRGGPSWACRARTVPTRWR